MTKTEQLDNLFLTWEKEGFDVFCKDGVVDEKKYKKILFVLKDVNNSKPDVDVDLRKNLVTLEGEGKTWFNVARWTNSLLRGELIENMTATMQHKILRNVAVMNLKKEAGGARVSDDCIREHSKKYCDNIRKEIAICDPNVIIACGNIVYDCLKEVVFNEESSKINCKVCFNEKMQTYGDGFGVENISGKNKTIYVIHYRHPNQATKQGTLKEHHENFVKIKNALVTWKK